MPFVKRKVSPVQIARRKIPESHKFELTAVCNNALLSVLDQLASLTLLADNLFSELTHECEQISLRTELIQSKVCKLEHYVDSMDFRSVPIPVGDLEQVETNRNHFSFNDKPSSQLLLPETRPPCVKKLYDLATANPLRIICECDAFRTDGQRGFDMFFVQPVVKEPIEEQRKDNVVHVGKMSFYGSENVGTRRALRRPDEKQPSASALNDAPCKQEERYRKQKSCSSLPPGNFVAIDISESNFKRTHQNRDTSRSASNEVLEEGTAGRSRRRHKRRQTVSGVPKDVMHDLTVAAPVNSGSGCVAGRDSRSLSRERLERPRSLAYLNRYAPRDERYYKSREELRRERIERELEREVSTGEHEKQSSLGRSCSIRRSMRSLFRSADKEKSKSMDLWADGRPASPGPPMVDLRQKRSRSLPRSLKSVKNSVTRLVAKSRSASTEGRLDDVGSHSSPRSAGGNKQQDANEFVTHVAKRKPRGLLRSMTKRISKSQSQLQTVAVNPRPMPKSMSASQNIRPQSLSTAFDSNMRASGLVSSPKTPQSESSSSGGGHQSRSYHRLNIPPGKAWQAFGGIKYRNPSSGARERQSSSGNWSGTDSQRFSSSSQQTTTSQSSYDSAVSFNVDHSRSYRRSMTFKEGPVPLNAVGGSGDKTPTDLSTVHDDTVTLNEDSDSTLNGSILDMNSSSAQAHAESTLTADDWLKKAKPLEKHKKRRSRKDRAAAAGISQKSPPNKSQSGLTMGNMQLHDHSFRSALKIKLTDDESSVYSVDQDGFYTSMHLDSGLKHSIQATIEEATATPKQSPTQQKQQHHKQQQQRWGRKPAPPPPPPRRQCSNLTNSAPLTHSQASLLSLNDQLDNLRLSQLSLNSVKSTGSHVSTVSQHSSNRTKSNRNSLQSETDSEVMYARVQDKSTISAAAYPSMCNVTPMNSDDDDDEAAADVTAITASKEARTPAATVHHQASSTGDDQHRNPVMSLQRRETRQNSFKMMVDSMQTSESYKPFELTSLTEVKADDNATATSAPQSAGRGRESRAVVTGTHVMQPPQNPHKPETRQSSFKMMVNSMLSTDGYVPYEVKSLNTQNVPLVKAVTTSQAASKAAGTKTAIMPPPVVPFNRLDPRQNSYRVMVNSLLESSYEKSDRSLDDSVISLEFDLSGMDLIDTSMYSTWPRQPKNRPSSNKQDVDTNENAEQAVENDVTKTSHLESEKHLHPEIQSENQQPEPKREESGNNRTTESTTAMTHAKTPAKTKVKSKPVEAVTGVTASKKTTDRKKKVKSRQATPYKYDTSTWPKKGTSSEHNSSVDDSAVIETTNSKTYTDPDDKMSWTSTFPRRKKQSQDATAVNASADQQAGLNAQSRSNSVGGHSTQLNQAPRSKSFGSASAAPTSLTPQAAHARLIISSPVSGQTAQAVNAHHKALCSPVSDRDFALFSSPSSSSMQSRQSSVDSSVFAASHSHTMFDFKMPVSPTQSTTNSDAGARPISQPLYPSIDAMKHSITFPCTQTRATGSTKNNNNKSWYDGIATKIPPQKSMSMSKQDSGVSLRQQRGGLSFTGYPFRDVVQDSFLSTLECSHANSKRVSRFSLLSTSSSDSSLSSKRPLSAAYSSDHTSTAASLKGSQSSLNRAETTSIGSNRAETMSIGSNRAETMSIGSNRGETTSIGSNHTTLSERSMRSQNSEKSLLSAFNATRTVSPPKSLGLKNKYTSKKSATVAPSSVNSHTVQQTAQSSSKPPTTAAASTKRSVTKKRNSDSKVVSSNSATAALPTLQSPSHLKRTSAVLDEEFDVFSLMKSQPDVVEAGLSPSRYFVSRSKSTAAPAQVAPPALLDSVSPKRQCLDRVRQQQMTKSSPSKSAMMRYRLRKSTSKLALNSSRLNLSTIEAETSPVHTSFANSPARNISQATKKSPQKSPYSQLILKNSPEKISLMTSSRSFTFTPNSSFETGERAADAGVTSTAETRQRNPSGAERMQASIPTNKVVSSVAQKRLIRSPASETKGTMVSNLPVAAARMLSMGAKQNSGSPMTDRSPRAERSSRTERSPRTRSKHRSKSKSAAVDASNTAEQQVSSASKLAASEAASPKTKLTKSPLHKSKTAEIKTLSQSSKPVSTVELSNSVEQPATSQITTHTPAESHALSLPKVREWKPSSSKSRGHSKSRTPSEDATNRDSPKQKTKKRSKSKVNSSHSDLHTASDTVSSNANNSTAAMDYRLRVKSLSTVDLQSRDSGKQQLSLPQRHESALDITAAGSLGPVVAQQHDMYKSGSMTKSLSNLSCLSLLRDQSMVVYDSQLSLGKSSESLASSVSSYTTADRTRSAKLAFLSQQQPSGDVQSKRSPHDPFSKYSSNGQQQQPQGRAAKSPRSRSRKASLKSVSCTSLNDDVASESPVRLVGTATQV